MKIRTHRSVFFLFFGILGVLISSFVVPTQLVQDIFSVYTPGLLDHNAYFLLGALVLCFLGSLGLRSAEKKTSRAVPEKPAGSAKAFLVALQIVLSLTIIGQAIYQIGDPRDFDENEQILEAKELSTFLPQALRLTTANHLVAKIVSGSSVYFFGTSKAASRVPAIVFTCCFLIALNVFCNRYASRLAAVLMLLHLNCNQLFLWYTHSPRGYIPAMFFTLVPFFLFFRWQEKSLRRPVLAGLGLCFAGILSLLSHFFGGLCFLLVIVTWIVWLGLNRRRIPVEKRLVAAKALLFVLPCIALLTVQALRLRSALTEDGRLLAIDSGDVESLFHPLYVLGISHGWWAKGILLFAFFLVIRRNGTQRLNEVSFPTLFLIILWTVVTPLLPWTSSEAMEPRFFLPFLLPVLLWLSDALQNLPPVARRFYTGVTLLFLTLLPLMDRNALHDSQTQLHSDFDFFVHTPVVIAAAKHLECIDFQGDTAQIEWAHEIYLTGEKRRPVEECKQWYLMAFDSQSPPPLIFSTRVFQHRGYGLFAANPTKPKEETSRF